MAADNESATRAGERRRLNLVITAFRGLEPSRDTSAGCAPGGPAVNRAGSGSGTMFKRHGGWIRWFFSGIWLVYLIAPVADLFGKGHGPLWIAGGVTLAIVFCAVYIAVLATWE